MNPTTTYDYLVTARSRILTAARALTTDEYTRDFSIGIGSLAVNLTHIMISEWYYVERINERPVPDYKDWPIKYENPPDFGTLEAEWATQTKYTRATIANTTDWSAAVEYDITMDDAHRWHVTTTKGDFLTQLFFHEIHHRAQAMAILRRHGHPIEEIDYNLTTFKRERISE